MLNLDKLNKEQREAAEYINGALLILAGAGTGKSLLNGSGVLTANGYVPIETLHIGDKVYGRDGELHNVIGVFPQGQKEIWEIEFSDGAIIKCCEDHLWAYHTASRRDKHGQWQVATTKELSQMDLKRKRGQWYRNNIYIPMCNPIVFADNHIPIPPYLMGALIGDGSLLSNAIKFSNNDQEVLNRVELELESIGCVLRYTSKYDYSICLKNNTQPSVNALLKKVGLAGTTSATKFIPKEYLYNTIENRVELLKGLIDTDGALVDDGCGYEYSTVSKQLALDMQFLCESLGMTARISEKQPTYTYNGEKKFGKKAYRIRIKTNETFKTISAISRKALHEDSTQCYARRHVVSIRNTGEYGEMTCISVDSADSLFITEHCVVTHNTTVLTYRVANMIEHNIQPEQILMLTFTNKAAREMKERVCKMIGEERGGKVLACTFHSFCALMLRKHGHHIGISPHFTILSPGDDEDIISIVKSYEDKTRYSGKGFPPNGKVCDFISKSTNKNIDLYDVMESTKYSRFVEEVRELKALSEDYRKEHDMLNYDDILVRIIDLFNMKPEIAELIANTYPYIMVDEYQDTNPLQEAILIELFRYTKNIAVVGDDMQSLYGFRGAEVENIINFPNKFKDCHMVTINRNYRSNQEILDLSNSVCTHATEGYPKELIGNHHSEILPNIVRVRNQYDEANFVVDLIHKLHNKRGIPYDQICVVERNSILSAGIEVKLNVAGIEFDKYGGAKYTDLSYVKDVLAYLKIMTNPYDEISFFRVLQVHRGIGNVNARKISEQCRVQGFKALLDKKYAKRNYGPELVRLHDKLTSCDGMKLIEMIESFIKFYCDTIKKNIDEMDTDEGMRTAYHLENENHREDLHKLVELAEHYRSVDSFLDDLLLDNTKADEHDSEGKVVISTIHSVKGLEFDTVIVLDCIDGVFPNADDIGSKEDNEELRCFYVAVTRAKERLYLMCPRVAMRYGQSIDGHPARYLEDAYDLITWKDATNIY